MTALCSRQDTTTWSPGLRSPFITILSAIVQFKVNATFSGFLAPNSSHATFLHFSISFPEILDIVCPLLPGFAPQNFIASEIAYTTERGLGYVVAELSKYITLFTSCSFINKYIYLIQKKGSPDRLGLTAFLHNT